MTDKVVTKKKTEKEGPKDCLACRVVTGTGLLGIAAYLANQSYKNQTLAGRVVISTLSLTFVSLSIARFKQTFPFERKMEDKN